MRHNDLSADSLARLLTHVHGKGADPTVVVRNANGTVLPFAAPTITRDADGTIVINVDTSEVSE
jgi:hypothetical protein